jgi:membrane protein implicated in regulation of membrane protease activity
MTQWWDALSAFQQAMFVLASTATFLMIVFLVLMIIGGDSGDTFEGDVDADIDADADADIGGSDVLNDEPLSGFGGLRLLTVRGVLAFLSVGAFTAFGFSSFISPWLSSLLGAIAGVIASYLLALAFRASKKLESTGNLNYQNAIGKSGNVYIKVPSSHSGIGKVTLTLQERFVEIDAVTLDTEDLMTGTAVEVVGLENETTLIVERKK